MRNIIMIGVSLVLLTAGVALAGKPQPPEPPPSSGSMELVGFTTATTAPNIGLFAMTNLCQAEYLDSHMCTSEEIMKTSNIPALPSETTAWIQPIIVGIYSTDYMDISGYRIMGYTPNCDNWSNNNSGNNGLAITDLGTIKAMGCFNQYLPVACCAPAQ